MNYEIDYQTTLEILMEIPINIYFKYDIFDEIARMCEKQGAQIFDDNVQFYLTPEEECDII